MYSVTVTIKAINPEHPNEKYKTKKLTGLYIPKNKTASSAVIEREAIEFFTKNIGADNSHLELSYQVAISKIKTDFHIAQQ